MKKFEEQLVNKTGVFPNMAAINSTGAATPDGSEYIAEIINNANYGPQQALMDYVDDGTNITALSGTPGVPNGRIEASADSQLLEAIQKGNGIGPGMLVQRAINDLPSVWGDRVIQLSGQGVLVATYPDLNNAVWIGGNTAAQVAAKAAGKEYWRADDAAGVTPNAAGIYLILPSINPSYFKQYLGDGTDFTVTASIAITLLRRAIAIPYLTSDGAWRLRFNIGFDTTAGSRSGLTVTLSGVTFKTGASYHQAITGWLRSGTVGTSHSVAVGGSGDMTVIHPNTGTFDYVISGDVELNSKPTWADDFQDNWYITY